MNKWTVLCLAVGAIATGLLMATFLAASHSATLHGKGPAEVQDERLDQQDDAKRAAGISDGLVWVLGLTLGAAAGLGLAGPVVARMFQERLEAGR